ncbi:10-formyltetrahydrofolate:L-methionyl-tRNA(fMet) N-formyltransferase [Nostocoides australiense Ben110]|uniref:Methionyl-tRNA formyltransferase n=1 Tax=Nostocoides australiense Ben110 TaxID=1193182 RepID=W6JWE3_9MICO|nr:methionyl-tRNA formyltransferase [Tetrasphaera australiensis]CCH72920.1 10-formyltetrahydrofolate:L-methionyl-tRNA(fMet) N-formyltransferase [Tetrasphaera australiensis Ben110]
MRLIFAGTPDVALPALDALAATEHVIAAVITRPDAPAGRGRKLIPSPVKARALELRLEVWEPARLSDQDFLSRLRAAEPDLCPVVAYGNLIPQAALDVPRHGWVNLHFSLLPAWRGAAPVQHAVIAGDEITGASTFLIEAGLDTGPVYGSLTEPVRPTDTSGDLLGRLADAGAGLLVATVDGIARGELVPVPQPTDGVSLAPKLDVADARIDFTHSALAVDRRIRGCTPAPGAWTTFRGERLKLYPVTVAAGSDSPLAPGELRASKSAVEVGTATVPVTLGQVQPLGKKPMPAADWARGVRIEPGERLGNSASTRPAESAG